MIIEATCKKCGETFTPHSVSSEDLEHWVRDDGVTECGGEGELVGIMAHHPSEKPKIETYWSEYLGRRVTVPED